MALKLASDVPAPEPTPATQDQTRVAQQLLMLAFKALSEKALIALGSMFSLTTAASVWWLAMSISSAPTREQLVLLGGYAAFVLLLHVARRK